MITKNCALVREQRDNMRGGQGSITNGSHGVRNNSDEPLVIAAIIAKM